MFDHTTALFIVIGIIGILFAIPTPETKKVSDEAPQPKPVVINVYRTSHVHKHVVVRVQMLVVPPAENPPAEVDAAKDAPNVPTTRALARYDAPLELPAPSDKIVA